LPTIAIDPIYHYQMQKVLDMDTWNWQTEAPTEAGFKIATT